MSASSLLIILQAEKHPERAIVILAQQAAEILNVSAIHVARPCGYRQCGAGHFNRLAKQV